MTYKPEDEPAPPAEFGQQRSFYAQMGTSQEWIDKFLPNPGQSRKAAGEVLAKGLGRGQYGGFSGDQLVADLRAQGWECTDWNQASTTVQTAGDAYVLSGTVVNTAGYDDWPPQLVHDIIKSLEDQGAL